MIPAPLMGADAGGGGLEAVRLAAPRRRHHRITSLYYADYPRTSTPADQHVRPAATGDDRRQRACAVAKAAGSRHYPRTTLITARESAGSGFASLAAHYLLDQKHRQDASPPRRCQLYGVLAGMTLANLRSSDLHERSGHSQWSLSSISSASTTGLRRGSAQVVRFTYGRSTDYPIRA